MMSVPLDLSVTSGPLRWALLAAGLGGVIGLLARRGRRWWTRTVPAAVGVGAVTAVLTTVTLDHWWHPFPDPLPGVAVTWAGMFGAAVVLAGARASTRPRGVPVVAVLLVLVCLGAAAQVNQHFHACPTVRAALGLPAAGQVDLTQVPAVVPLAPAARGALSRSWTPPPGLPGSGVLSTAAIPSTVSGFPARGAWVYLPPAYLTSPRKMLPVLVLLAGQPGSPRDWVDGGQLARTMDVYAHGNAATYLTTDVPFWIRRTLQVDPDPRHWAVAGSSAGGTCALQLAVTAPTVYPTFVDTAGEAEPTLGTRARTVEQRFGGDPAAFARANPVDVLAARPLPGTAGMVVAGRDDATYRPQARTVAASARSAGVEVTYLEIPGGHSWQVWSAGLAESMPFLAARTGLAP